MNDLEVLKGARDRIQRGWTIEARGRDFNGTYRDGYDHRAVKWCAVGAVDGALGRDSDGHAVISLLSAEIFALELPERHQHPDTDPLVRVAQFNNSHTQVEVLAKFDAAIAKLSPEKAAELDPAFTRFKALLAQDQPQRERESVGG